MRAALYARTACLTQDLNSAVELQLEALRNYGTQNGMEIVEEFTDAGYSGLRRDRPCASGLLGHAPLELRRALGGAPRPFAQALDLARLREVEEGEDRKPGYGDEAGQGADVLQRPLHREGKHGIHQVRGV